MLAYDTDLISTFGAEAGPLPVFFNVAIFLVEAPRAFDWL